jgi:hypothetical protein
MSNEDYRSTIAAIGQMKQEAQLRQQHQLIREAQVLHQEVQENEQLASEALASGDTDTANYYVEQLTEKEQELASVAERLPPMPPPDDPLKREFMAMLKPWIDKDPQRATQLLGLAHQRVTQPRVRFPTPNNMGGMGIRENTRAYWRNMRDNLHLYAKDFGLPYDQGMEMPHWRDAAHASGLSEQSYTNAWREMKRQGRIS